MNIRDIQVEAPWGYIALKLWGDEKNQAILTVHGILDNAGSFDRLIPLLPKEYFYICVDLPGHGRSSFFPPHLPIHSTDYILVYNLVMDYFKKAKYIIMGHSYGGQLGYLYTQLNPDRIEKLILLDTLCLFPVSTHSFQQYLVDKFSMYLNIEDKLKNTSPPQYTYEEALQKVMEGHLPGICQEAATGLLKRMLIAKENGKYELSVDQRLKNFINPLYDINYALKLNEMFPVHCPVLIIFGSASAILQTIFKKFLEALEKKENVQIEYAEGFHDVHNENPEKVAPHIVEFLSKRKSKL